MGKNLRRDRIIDIISKNEINTQDELVKILLEEGFDVTQATVSRDIQHLGLVKVKGNTKNYKYALPKSANDVTDDKVLTLLKTFIIGVKTAKNLIVIKTLAGNGSSCGMAIDKLKSDKIIGSIAGDDTLLIVCKTDEEAELEAEEIRALTGL